MADINQSLNEGVCVDDEVFFGPVTDKERKVRENFENKMHGELPIIDENDISRNDSLYVSFSVEESKYNSFDDSLNEDLDRMPQEAKHTSLRKSLDKLKPKKHGFYDSLEDVCSLASNVEKCSISCEVENEKQHIIDDSLRNPPAAVSKSCVNEQIHFDDDSLAIVEMENTFDDSLEELNVLSSIEIEEINDVEITATENQTVSPLIDQTTLFVPRNLFEASVPVIYENKNKADMIEPEDSSGDKNILYDSLSNSDLKDILKDSLEESEKCADNLLKNVSDVSIINAEKPEQINIFPSIKIDEIKDAKPIDSKLKISENLNSTSLCHFDTSVQIIYEKGPETTSIEQDESSEDKNNVLYDSLSNSDFKDILMDSLEDAGKCTVDLKQVSDTLNTDAERVEQISIQSDILDNSVQIIYDNFHPEKNISSDVTNSELNILKYSFENIETSRDCGKERVTEPQPGSSSFIPSTVINSSNIIDLDSNANQRCKVSADRFQPVIDLPISAVENHNLSEGTFTVDSCHLKLLNDNINVDKDLKFELQIEVTVGDKKCKIAAEDIKLLPVTNFNSKSSESNLETVLPVEVEKCMEKEKTDILDSCSSSVDDKNNESILNTSSNENEFYEKQQIVNEANITRRSKVISQQIDNSDLNSNFLQALDLHNLSTSFLNDSVIQSADSVIPLNLCSREHDIKNIQTSLFRNESKENVPESVSSCKTKNIGSPCKKNESKLNCRKTPNSALKSPSSKETKRTPGAGTKIPVRKVENFVVPSAASSKFSKQVSSAERVKKHPCSHTSRSAEKKTPMSTPNKTPHFCKVRNTIFSKVPQIVPSKKYMNIQSPVAQYIRNTPGSSKTPILDPVLHDCTNHMQESPYHLYQATKSGSAKSIKRKV